MKNSSSTQLIKRRNLSSLVLLRMAALIALSALILSLSQQAQAQTSLTRMSLHEAQLGLIKGQKAITSGQFSEGVALLTRVLRARALPKDQAAQAFYDRGLAYQSLQDYDKAAQDYSQALALNILTGTYRARALYNRGLAQMNLGNKNAAMSDFSKAIQSSQDLPQAYYQRGKLNAAAAQYDLAITDFKTAIANQMPSSEWAWLEMSKAQGAKGQWALAQNALNSALQINPQFTQARQQMAIVSNNLQNTQSQPAAIAPQQAKASSYTDPIVTNSISPQSQTSLPQTQMQSQTGQWDTGGLTPKNIPQTSQANPTRLTANQTTGSTSLYVPGPGFDAARKATPPAPTNAVSQGINGYIMQLSAHNNVAAARQRWTSLYNKHTDILGGLSPLIQSSVSAAGHTFYRLRTGPFPKKADGMTLCQALKARGQDCFVTYTK